MRKNWLPDFRMGFDLQMFPTLTFIFAVVSLFETHAQIADDKCKFLGNIVSGSPAANFGSLWNQVTPENSGKWESVESVRDVMNWTSLDNAYNFSRTNNFAFKQHTFVWNNQQPAWLSTLTQEEIRQEVEEWIQQFCERYPETEFIDVVNEPINAPAFYRNALGGEGAVGSQWVVWAFEKARAHCPNAKLILNEYNIINNNAATEQYIRIINILKSHGLIDGIGVQGHFFELGNATASTLKNNLDKLQLTGLPVYISEFEIDLADDTAQKQKFEELFPILWEHPGVQGVTLWGYLQGQMWKENGYLVRTNQTERPALTWLKSYVSSTLGGTFCLTTDVEENLPDIDVYPNPSTGQVTIETPNSYSSFKLLDLWGQVVFDKTPSDVIGNKAVTLNLSTGIYFLCVSSGTARTIKKITIL